MRTQRAGATWSTGRRQRRDQYAHYMNSAAWAVKRRWWVTEHRRRTGTDPVCVVCGATQFDLHHLDYEHLGHEGYEDLIPVCRTHHDRIHNAWDLSPTLRKMGRRAASLSLIATMRTTEQRCFSKLMGARPVQPVAE